MEKSKIRDLIEEMGMDRNLVDLPIVDDILELQCKGKSDEEVKSMIALGSRGVLRIGSVTIKTREDGTLRIERQGHTGYFITDKNGIEVERVLEVTKEGERKIVRRDGTIREVIVTDQGESFVDEQVILDNGHPSLQFAKGAKVRDSEGNPIYFNADDELRAFDESTRSLKLGTKDQRVYYREARKD